MMSTVMEPETARTELLPMVLDMASDNVSFFLKQLKSIVLFRHSIMIQLLIRLIRPFFNATSILFL